MTEGKYTEKDEWTPERVSEFVRRVMEDVRPRDRDSDPLESFRAARAGLDGAARDITSLRRRGRRTRPA